MAIIKKTKSQMKKSLKKVGKSLKKTKRKTMKGKVMRGGMYQPNEPQVLFGPTQRKINLEQVAERIRAQTMGSQRPFRKQPSSMSAPPKKGKPIKFK